MKWNSLTLTLMLLLPAAALAGADEEALAGRPKLGIHRADKAPALDGRLDDEVWRTASRATTFTQQNPREGEPATENTEVWIAYDSSHLYIAIHAHYADTRLMRANRTDRDRTERDDRVSVYFDTFLDQQRAYRFSVNGYGVQGDAILNAGGRGGPGGGGPGGGPGGGGGGGGHGGEDSSWDALFNTAGGPVEDGWIVEMAIPFKSLRYPSRTNGDEHRWGFQIVRTIEGKDEDVSWSPITRNVEGFLTQMGVLYGMRDLSTSKNIEIQPTATAVRAGTLDSDTGAYTQVGLDPDFGVNFKYGLTTNLTADFTYNPDFSQIESDRAQIEVNQRFPVSYPEKRPFFLEGQEIFDTQINLVHSRTIVDPLAGGKLTGKAGATSIGVLVANDEAAGYLDDTSDPAYGKNAQVGIFRVRRDLYAESFVGAIVTDREFADTFSRALGFDSRFRLGATHRFSLMVAGTDSRDDEDGREAGYGVQAGFSRSARHLGYSISHTNYSPGFKTDVGFIRRVDIQETSANTNYTFWPGGTIVNWGPRAQYRINFDHAGVKQDEEIEGGVNFRFARNIGVRANATRDMERYEGIDFHKRRYSVGGDTSFSRRFSFGGNWNWGDGIRYDEENPYMGRTYGGSVNLSVRPTSRLSTGLNLNLSRFYNPATGERVFDVQLYRAQTSYQFTDRLLLRNILEYDTYAGKFGFNLLFTYRVNAGSVLFIGYDDRLQEAHNINEEIFTGREMTRTSRAFFMKISYLFRY